jgi:hypothetical protein
MKIDAEKKEKLIRHIQSREGSGREILLFLEHYFDGYEEEHCTICANSQKSVSTKEFSERLSEIGQRADVTGIFIRFYDYEDALNDETCWVGSDSVCVVTSAEPNEVQEWLSDFEPSTVTEETDVASFDGLPPIPPGFRLVRIWWD